LNVRSTADVANKTLIDASMGEMAKLQSLEVQRQTYQLIFQVTPGTATITVVTDLAGSSVQSAKRQ
jgi:hypothetical protein